MWCLHCLYSHGSIGLRHGRAYFLQQKGNDRAIGNQETKFGFNFGGGMEYFLNRRVAIKGEGRYHMIENPTTGVDPSGLGLSVGLKTYF